MKALRKYLDNIKPNFMPGGKFAKLQSVFEGFETFLFTPDTTRKTGVHVHDSIDLKRTMIIVVISSFRHCFSECLMWVISIILQ